MAIGMNKEVTMDEMKELDIMGVQVQIDDLKAELASLDYIGIKIAEGVATREEYSEKLAYKEELRKKINELQDKIESMTNN